MGLLVLKACDLRNKKFDAKKIARRLEGLVSKVHTTFVLDSLEYLHKGGRCSAVARFGANVLGLKPSIAVSTETGRLDVAKKYRGKIDIVYRQYISQAAPFHPIAAPKHWLFFIWMNNCSTLKKQTV